VSDPIPTKAVFKRNIPNSKAHEGQLIKSKGQQPFVVAYNFVCCFTRMAVQKISVDYFARQCLG
jgi:hypothetical protein